jgi:type II secretory pathway pseudopilin PulG
MRRRSGFTITEMLVSVALIVFVMVILTEAFQKGLEGISKLKAIGDMEQRLRTAATVLRRDLFADHFEGSKRLSDPHFWREGPPREGFFRIWQGSAPSAVAGSPYFLEGTDGDNIPSFRATNHLLHFAIKLRGNNRQDFLSARVPGQPAVSPLRLALVQPDSRYLDPIPTPAPPWVLYNSQWAEVAYFLRPTGVSAGTTPLFALYRRQLLAVPDNSLNWTGPVPAAEAPNYLEISGKPFGAALHFNSPADLTVPQRRFGLLATADGGLPSRPDASYPIFGDPAGAAGEPPSQVTTPTLQGADLLLTNVLSFQVRILPAISGDAILPFNDDFVDLHSLDALRLPGSGNPLFSDPNTRRVYDTWSSVRDDLFDYSPWSTGGTAKSIPLYQLRRTPASPIGELRILALQITLRVWDAKTGQARQITIVQDM